MVLNRETCTTCFTRIEVFLYVNLPFTESVTDYSSQAFTDCRLLPIVLLNIASMLWSACGVGIDYSVPSSSIWCSIDLPFKLSQAQNSHSFMNAVSNCIIEHVTQFSTSDWVEVIWYTQLSSKVTPVIQSSRPVQWLDTTTQQRWCYGY